MLPRTWLPEQDLILCASLRRTVTTVNVHPLYLPPVVCWLNSTQVKVQRFKTVLLRGLSFVSTAVVLLTLFLHAIRLCNISKMDLLDAIWSISICTALSAGLICSILSSDTRNRSNTPSGLTDTLSGMSWCHKAIMCTLFLAAYVYTWVYHRTYNGYHAPGGVRTPSWDTRVLVEWTTCSFMWINVIGFMKLRVN